MKQADEAGLPPLIQEILEPPTEEEAKPVVEAVEPPPAPTTPNDIEAMLDVGARAELVEAGFDVAELQALDDIDPAEQDASDDEFHALLLEALDAPT